MVKIYTIAVLSLFNVNFDIKLRVANERLYYELKDGIGKYD